MPSNLHKLTKLQCINYCCIKNHHKIQWLKTIIILYYLLWSLWVRNSRVVWLGVSGLGRTQLEVISILIACAFWKNSIALSLGKGQDPSMFSFHDELKRFNLCDQWARAPQFHVPKLRASWQQCNLSGSNLAIMWYRLHHSVWKGSQKVPPIFKRSKK